MKANATPDEAKQESCSRIADRDKTVNRISSALCGTIFLLLCFALVVVLGCGTAKKENKRNEFFTSGNREADQRASQRMAKAEQLAGSGEGGGEKKDKAGDEKAEQKRSLYERLGAEQGLTKIVDDFMARALQDPRVNWERKGVKRGGFHFGANKSVEWNPSAENVARVKKHLIQFFSLATGGPPEYQGKDMKSAHADMHISNAEFDAAVGDLKASLDNLQVQNREQKELIAIVESTRPQIVTQR